MPFFIINKLDCDDVKTTMMTLTLEDYSITYPYGVLEDVLVKVDDFIFLTNFIILELDEDLKVSLTIRRPLLSTSRSLIYVELGELILRFQNEQVIFYVFEIMCRHNKNLQCYRVDVVEEVVKEMSQSESSLLPIKRVIVNSTDTIKETQDRVVEQCVCHL